MRCGSSTGLPSSLKPMTPDWASSHISANSLPALPLLTQPMGKTLTILASLAFFKTYSTTLALSTAGLVLGMAQMVVKPPLAAAWTPVAIVSLSSYPGSRRCVCTSMKPGQATSPRPSMTRQSGGTSPSRTGSPTCCTRPSMSRRSPVLSMPADGSSKRASRTNMGPVTVKSVLHPDVWHQATGTAGPCARPRRWPPVPQ